MSDCDRVKSLTQKALKQRARHYQVIYSLSIFFEGDQTGAAEDSKIFLDMVRCLGAEGESLRIPLSSPRFGGPGWEVNDRVAAFIKQGIQLDPEHGRVPHFHSYFTTQGMGPSATMDWYSLQILEPSAMIELSIPNWGYITILVKVWKYLIASLSWTVAIQVMQPDKATSRPDVPKYSLLWEKTNPLV